MSIVFTADESGKVTPIVEPHPRISPELAAKIAECIWADQWRHPDEAGIKTLTHIIERVWNAE